MELTPIKVRGKRRRRGESKPPTIWPPKQKEKREMEKRPKKKRRKPLSLEERLPLEVLERIFLMSENLNFARCSQKIGFLLSSRKLLLELVITAFGPTWDNWFGCVSSEVLSYKGYSTDDAHRLGGNPELQSAILECPWAKLAVIHDAQQLWFRRHGVGRYYRHLAAIEAYHDLSSLVESHTSEGFDHVNSVQQCFAVEKEIFGRQTIQLELTQYGTGKNRRTHLDVHPQTKIPDVLLSGPFDREMCNRLFWLVKGGARLSAAENWEVTQEGFKNILALKDDAMMAELLNIFDMLGVFRVQWPKRVLQEAVGKVSVVLRNDLAYREFRAFSFLSKVFNSQHESVNSLAQWYGDVCEEEVTRPPPR